MLCAQIYAHLRRSVYRKNTGEVNGPEKNSWWHQQRLLNADGDEEAAGVGFLPGSLNDPVERQLLP